MGTKKNPGAFDCYANAKEDEPMFILLARDVDAPGLVEAWAAIREERGEDPLKIAEARQCAERMRDWLLANPKSLMPKEADSPLIDAENWEREHAWMKLDAEDKRSNPLCNGTVSVTEPIGVLENLFVDQKSTRLIRFMAICGTCHRRFRYAISKGGESKENYVRTVIEHLRQR